MALKKKPVTGMKDMMPGEMEIRDYCIGLIKETYKAFGFSSIETPCVEHLENLCSKQGGDNEKLIFKILKRGEKLKIDAARDEADLVDGGLRYDLTVPLCRYYSNNANDLPSPFKALQMGNVWRADRPQRGRFRQFMQCDIDILGEPGNLTIRINDRRFLKAMAAYSGFQEADYENVFITLDKMDKIGMDGVAAELEDCGYAKESVEKYLQLFKEITGDVEGVRYCKEKLEGFLENEAAASLEMIITSVESAKEADFRITFDPTGQNTPAVGFSIGLERIVMLLLERGYQVPSSRDKKAFLIEKNMPQEGMLKVLNLAKAERAAGRQVMIANMKKNKKFQKEQLTEQGYGDIVECYRDSIDTL